MNRMIGTDAFRNFKKDFKQLENKEKGKLLQKYFKTGIGEYGEGDIFAGLTVPQSRSLAVKYKDLDLSEISTLLQSKIHEERLIALLILVHNFQKNPLEQKAIYDFYLKNTQYINNWDLVDLSSPEIIGEYLLDRPKDILLKLAKSKNIWEKRIAMISTFIFIRENEFETSFKIAQILIDDREDLIQKAVGWMLREIGKRGLGEEEKFLKVYYKKMGRTALRYAIEKFPQAVRLKYLRGEI
jgi:3-methyladenine DNA glycosylase AlkD